MPNFDQCRRWLYRWFCFRFSADTAAREAYIEWFRTTDLMHVSSIDLSLMALFMVDPLREDMRRRGWKPDPARVAFFWVPIIGPALWLIVRPPVADGAA